MNSRWCLRVVLWLLIPVISVYTGCAGTQPSRFYSLTAISGIQKIEPKNGAVNGKAIGVGPVEIPSYVDRPQIVTQKGPHQIHVAEFDRWAGSLKENINSVVAENLSVLLSDHMVYVFPWMAVQPVQYQITVRIMRLDAVPGEAVILDAHWWILGKNERGVVQEQRSQIRIPLSGKGYNDIVAAQSMALGELSREMALAIQTLRASLE